MSQLHNILLRPVLTEKSHQMDADNKVVFRVRKDATKHQIRAAVESLFEVNVDAVRTLTMPGKPKRFGRFQAQRSGYKKAVVTLEEGQSIDFYALEDAVDDSTEEDAE